MPDDNVLVNLNDQIYTHFDSNKLVVKQRPSFGCTPTSSTPRLEYLHLPWGIYLVKRKTGGTHGSVLAPASLVTRDVTMNAIIKYSQPFRSPVGDVDRGILFCCMFATCLCCSFFHLFSIYADPTFGKVTGPLPSLHDMRVHPCLASRAMDRLHTHDVNEITSNTTCIQGCPTQEIEDVCS